jgi:hypothetical protein
LKSCIFEEIDDLFVSERSVADLIFWEKIYGQVLNGGIETFA